MGLFGNTCAYCGKSGLFLSLEDGFCKDCYDSINKATKRCARVIRESAEIIENVDSLKVRISRCNTIIQAAQELAKYVEAGIASVDPPPEELINTYQERRELLKKERDERQKEKKRREEEAKRKQIESLSTGQRAEVKAHQEYELVCDKCEQSIPGGANFCPHCGDPVTEEDEVPKVGGHTKSSTITLEFGYSTSKNYDKAVRIAERVSSYEVTGEGKDAHHELEISTEDVKLAITLWELIGGWTSSRMAIDGERVTKKDLVYGALGCYQNRQEAYDGIDYCFGADTYGAQNLWGCKRLHLSIHDMCSSEYGYLDEDGIWHLDKNALRKHLERELHDVGWCPAVDEQKVWKMFDRLPSSIDPRHSDYWEYRYEYKQLPDSFDYEEVPVSISPVVTKITDFIEGPDRPEFSKPDWAR